MLIQSYDQSQKSIWDAFVRSSKNGTFLFLRDYMDYHRDRFDDKSFLISNQDGQLVALLPAHRCGTTLVSHGGLTYGGFVTDEAMKVPQMLQVFDAVLSFLRGEGFKRVIYKTIPHVYHRIPAEEDRYALFLCGAHLVRRGVLAVVERDRRLPFQERRIRGAKKALRNGLTVGQSEDWETFWQILSDRLMKTYCTQSVHSVHEIRLLHAGFPGNIKLFACFQNLVMLAGVVIYESAQVAHAQYIAASDQGRELGALDLLFEELMTGYYNAKPYFDLGTSDEDDGRYLNKGLIEQKEGFGARAIVHDHYEIPLDTWQPGKLLAAMVPSRNWGEN